MSVDKYIKNLFEHKKQKCIIKYHTKYIYCNSTKIVNTPAKRVRETIFHRPYFTSIMVGALYSHSVHICVNYWSYIDPTATTWLLLQTLRYKACCASLCKYRLLLGCHLGQIIKQLRLKVSITLQ